MSERKTIKLAHPIEHGSTVIEELAFRRGRASDMKGLVLSDSLPVDMITKVASRLCGQPTSVIEKLDEDDIGEVFAIAINFIERCLQNGTVSSE